MGGRGGGRLVGARAVPRPCRSEARGSARCRHPSTSPSCGVGKATGCVTAQATLHSHVVNPESRDFYEAGRGHWSDATLEGAGFELELPLRFVQNIREDSECKPPSFISFFPATLVARR